MNPTKRSDSIQPRDDQQKVKALELLSSLGYAVFPEILVTQDPASRKTLGQFGLEITDVDVMGLTVTPLLRIHSAIVDCTTRRGVSVIHRALWLRALLDFVACDQGIVVVQKDIHEDHRAAATQAGVDIFSTYEFDRLCHSLPTQRLHADFEACLCMWRSTRERMAVRFPKLADYARRTFWMRGWNRRLYSLPAVASECGKYLRPDRADDVDLFFHLALLYSAAVTHLGAHVFSQQPGDLRDCIRSYVHGGMHNIRWMSSVLKEVQDIIDHANVSDMFEIDLRDIRAVDPRYFDLLAELIHRISAKPSTLRELMRIVQLLDWQRQGMVQLDAVFWNQPGISLTRKFAIDLLELLAVAMNCTPDFTRAVVGVGLSSGPSSDRRVRGYVPCSARPASRPGSQTAGAACQPSSAPTDQTSSDEDGKSVGENTLSAGVAGEGCSGTPDRAERAAVPRSTYTDMPQGNVHASSPEGIVREGQRLQDERLDQQCVVLDLQMVEPQDSDTEVTALGMADGTSADSAVTQQ